MIMLKQPSFSFLQSVLSPVRLPVFSIDARGGQQTSVCSPSSCAGRDGSSWELTEKHLDGAVKQEFIGVRTKRSKEKKALDEG